MIDAGYTLTQVKLLGHQQQGYCLPPFASVAHLEDANQLSDADMGHFHEAAPSLKPVDMLQGDVYVPEYRNSGGGVIRLPSSVCGSETVLEKSLSISSSLWIMMMPAGLQPPGQ